MYLKKGEESLEERVELSLLYDFYGALLKENQQRMFEASILEDYNLAEIAEEEGITRQGVHDAIKRATKQLWEYEEKLGLVKRFQKQHQLVQELQSELKQIEVPKQDNTWNRIFSLLEDILKEVE